MKLQATVLPSGRTVSTVLKWICQKPGSSKVPLAPRFSSKQSDLERAVDGRRGSFCEWLVRRSLAPLSHAPLTHTTHAQPLTRTTHTQPLTRTPLTQSGRTGQSGIHNLIVLIDGSGTNAHTYPISRNGRRMRVRLRRTHSSFISCGEFDLICHNFKSLVSSNICSNRGADVVKLERSCEHKKGSWNFWFVSILARTEASSNAQRMPKFLSLRFFVPFWI